ncbi:15978_t:CDS:2, partial [Racocetra fulgida]
MPRPTTHQKKAKKAYEAKAHKYNTNANNSEAENSDNTNNISVYDEAVENDNAASIIKQLQAAVKQYDHYSNNTELEDDDNDGNLSAYNEPIENDNTENIVKKLQDAVNKYYQECDSSQPRRLHYLGNSVRTKRRKRQQQREAAKGTPPLHTFWNQEKSHQEAGEVKSYDEQLEDEGQLEEVDEEVNEEVNEEDAARLSEDEIEICNWRKKIPAALENLTLDIKKENVNSEVWENKWDITPRMIMLQMNEVILPGLGFAPPPTISLNIAKNYLKELGYIYERVQKGVYVDGHEREDVVAYQNIFLRQMRLGQPGCQALFVFDNATSHVTFSPDALIANRMNLNPAEKQKKMRNTSYFHEGIKYDQDMVFPSDYHISKLCGEAKGLREVLTERGLWPEEGLKLKEARELM